MPRPLTRIAVLRVDPPDISGLYMSPVPRALDLRGMRMSETFAAQGAGAIIAATPPLWSKRRGSLLPRAGPCLGLTTPGAKPLRDHRHVFIILPNSSRCPAESRCASVVMTFPPKASFITHGPAPQHPRELKLCASTSSSPRAAGRWIPAAGDPQNGVRKRPTHFDSDASIRAPRDRSDAVKRSAFPSSMAPPYTDTPIGGAILVAAPHRHTFLCSHHRSFVMPLRTVLSSASLHCRLRRLRPRAASRTSPPVPCAEPISGHLPHCWSLDTCRPDFGPSTV